MKQSRFTEERIIAILREHEAGSKTGDICRKHGISSATFYKWKAKYGGLDVSEAGRLKILTDEMTRPFASGCVSWRRYAGALAIAVCFS
jgi:putative transposase